MINDDDAGSWARPDQASNNEAGARERPAKPCPAVRSKDHTAWSDKEHSHVDLFDMSVDSLSQCCGQSKSVREGLHVLVRFIISGDAPEMLCPAIAEDSHFASSV